MYTLSMQESGACYIAAYNVYLVLCGDAEGFVSSLNVPVFGPTLVVSSDKIVADDLCEVPLASPQHVTHCYPCAVTGHPALAPRHNGRSVTPSGIRRHRIDRCHLLCLASYGYSTPFKLYLWSSTHQGYIAIL